MYRKAPATIHQLAECLKIGTQLIHIACHGELESNLKLKMGNLFYAAYENKGDFLLFEDQMGNS